MAKGVSISVASDTRDFLKGIKSGVIEPLEDASDVLKDLGKDGEKAGQKLEDSMRDAQRDTEKLAKEYDDLGDKIRESSRKGGQGLKDNTHDATSAAARDLGELKNEAVQNASETFSSFDGSVDSLADGIQGTFGGIVSSLGPVGAAAGAAAAIGIGLLTAELQKSAEEANRVREETSELASEIIDAGGSLDNVALADRVKEWSLEIADNKEWWEVWQAASTTNLDKVRDLADKTGTDFKTMFNAMSGLDSSQSLDLLEDLEGKLEDVTESYNNLAGARAGGSKRAGELKEEKEALEASTKAIREKLGVEEGGIEDAREIIELTDKRVASEEAAAAALEASATAAGSLQGALDEGISAWSDYVDAESGAADPEKYMSAMQARIDATTNFNDNVRTLAETTGLTTEEMQAVLDQGVDFGPTLASIVAGGEESMGKYAGLVQQIIGGGQELIDGQPLSATVTAKGDTTAANAELDKTAEDRGTTVEAAAETKAAGRDLDDVADKRRTATIRARAETGTASSTLSNLARDRSMTVTVNIDKAEAERQLTEFQNRYRETTVNVKTRGGKENP